MNAIKKAFEKIKRVRDCIYLKTPGVFAIQDLFYWDEFVKNWKIYFGFNEDTDIVLSRSEKDIEYEINYKMAAMGMGSYIPG